MARLVFELAVFEKGAAGITVFSCPRKQSSQAARSLAQAILDRSSGGDMITLKVVRIDFLAGRRSLESAWLQQALNNSALSQLAVVDLECEAASDHLLRQVVSMDFWNCCLEFSSEQLPLLLLLLLLFRPQSSRSSTARADGCCWKDQGANGTSARSLCWASSTST